MTEEEIDQVIEATSPRPGAQWTAPFRRFATWFVTTRVGIWATEKTARWQTIIAVLVVAGIGFPLVANSIGATNQRVTDQSIYVTASVAYANSVNQYTVCVAAATAFQIDRDRWETLAETFGTTFPDSEGAQLVSHIITDTIAAPDPLVVSDCVPPGEPPTPPSP